MPLHERKTETGRSHQTEQIMTELERYICDNREDFDSAPLPADSRRKFMEKVAAEKRKSRIRYISMASAGMAAAITLFAVLIHEPEMERTLKNHHIRMTEKEMDIITLAETMNPYEMDEVINSIRAITFEAIPLEDQLPEELPTKEKIRILNDYYNQKYEALESLLAQL